MKIAPDAKRLKNNLKVPMVSMCLTCGLMNGCALVYIKVCLEIINSPEASSNMFFSMTMCFLGIFAAFINIIAVNMSLKFYNNLDVMPTYQSSILINVMVAGMILIDESKLYTWAELLILYSAGLVVIMGIFVLTKKQNKVIIDNDIE